MQAKKRVRMEAGRRLVGTGALAARLGVSRYQIYAVTRGLRRPSARLAARLRRLGVEVPSMEGGAE